MSIIGVQLILLFFAFFMIYVLFIHWKKKEISNMTLEVWIIIWVTFIILTLTPVILEKSILKLFFVRVMDFGMIVAFMILTYLTIENNIYLKKTENKIEKVVRYLAKRSKKIKL